MVKSIVILSLIVCASSYGEITPINKDYRDKIVKAIYKAENSVKYPYGIKSIPIKGNTQLEREAYARKICINTVTNTYIRWQKAGKTNDFITFLGKRYAPVGAKDDPSNLNSNWIKNIKKIMGQ